MLTMTMMMMLFVLLLLVPVVVVLARLLWNKAQGRRRYVCVLVLGDLGRSPRMQYHVLSLSKTVEHVFTVAYAGSRPVEDIVSAQNITFVDIPTPPTLPPGWPRLAFVLYAPVKVVLQSVQLVYSLLFRIPACTHLLMQNPPSIPAMPIAVLVCWLTGTTLVIDWHNYGFSILALKLGKRHVFVRLSEWIERTFGRLGSRHLCVTDAMARDLRDNWGITATTLHDRPPKYFKPKAAAVTHDLFMRFEQDHKRLLAPLRKRIGVSANQTLLTTKTGDGDVTFRRDRPAVVVSGTSWTPDEDFTLLLDALIGYERDCEAAGAHLPPLLCIITGKGPMRKQFEERIASLALHHVTIVTAWLRIEDYPHMLASADIGVSLHLSSSGLDLPMKVVDMFGCELPVCAVNFPCLHELVKDGENGRVFDTSEQLHRQLKELLAGFPESAELKRMRANLSAFTARGWDVTWRERARDVFAS